MFALGTLNTSKASIGITEQKITNSVYVFSHWPGWHETLGKVKGYDTSRHIMHKHWQYRLNSCRTKTCECMILGDKLGANTQSAWLYKCQKLVSGHRQQDFLYTHKPQELHLQNTQGLKVIIKVKCFFTYLKPRIDPALCQAASLLSPLPAFTGHRGGSNWLLLLSTPLWRGRALAVLCAFMDAHILLKVVLWRGGRADSAGGGTPDGEVIKYIYLHALCNGITSSSNL